MCALKNKEGFESYGLGANGDERNPVNFMQSLEARAPVGFCRLILNGTSQIVGQN
jgi:hypothetical protein